ncbi:uncharacterized protein SOCE836_020970 [Sorangium cellulosum]|uniref:Uncharacterized protein n=1 Tax=Sorangium cellulosum TaxID=56 RepID=A0A4V0NFK6_SORCE|nr:uncharacterized protein SOCE836_020970 [Sorangium cellulosum]WCQ89392.1 hypothetical protein NQZ70_02080 [Sorangium sp. Soce836]
MYGGLLPGVNRRERLPARIGGAAARGRVSGEPPERESAALPAPRPRPAVAPAARLRQRIDSAASDAR